MHLGMILKNFNLNNFNLAKNTDLHFNASLRFYNILNQKLDQLALFLLLE